MDIENKNSITSSSSNDADSNYYIYKATILLKFGAWINIIFAAILSVFIFTLPLTIPLIIINTKIQGHQIDKSVSFGKKTSSALISVLLIGFTAIVLFIVIDYFVMGVNFIVQAFSSLTYLLNDIGENIDEWNIWIADNTDLLNEELTDIWNSASTSGTALNFIFMNLFPDFSPTQPFIPPDFQISNDLAIFNIPIIDISWRMSEPPLWFSISIISIASLSTLFILIGWYKKDDKWILTKNIK
ncbi:MAG: hypothetical protein GQ557_00625 [Mycoplasmataceae bacterium]|nr:hypothetical protein [Mycoplasmataceae bacterium]